MCPQEAESPGLAQEGALAAAQARAGQLYRARQEPERGEVCPSEAGELAEGASESKFAQEL